MVFKKGVEPWNKGMKGLDIGWKKGKPKPKELCNQWSKTQKEKWKNGEYQKNKGNFEKGHTPWNKGTKGIMKPNKSSFQKGRISERKGQPFIKIKGSNHYNWKGGITSLNQKIRDSIEYREWKDAVFGRDMYTCQMCGKKGCYLEAHHIKLFSKYPKLRFKIENGITLCKKCHNSLRGKEEQYEEMFLKMVD